MALDARVHRFIYRCADNPYMEETLGRYFNLSLRIWYLVLDRLPHLFARVHEHDDVLHAIAAGKAALARDILAEHIATFEREIRAVLLSGLDRPPADLVSRTARRSSRPSQARWRRRARTSSSPISTRPIPRAASSSCASSSASIPLASRRSRLGFSRGRASALA